MAEYSNVARWSLPLPLVRAGDGTTTRRSRLAPKTRPSTSSGGELTAKSQRSQAFAISDGATVCREVRFVVEIQRQIFGVLRLNDLDVFREDLVIEVESLFDRRILVEVAAERDKEPRSARRDW